MLLTFHDDIKIMKRTNDENIQKRTENINDETFNEFIQTGNCSENLQTNLNLLGLDTIADNDILLKYKDQITDKFKLSEHLNIIITLKDDQTKAVKIVKAEETSYNIQCI